MRELEASGVPLLKGRPSGYWGNYPVGVLVKGRFVACDRAEKRFLIPYSDAVGLSLDCK